MTPDTSNNLFLFHHEGHEGHEEYYPAEAQRYLIRSRKIYPALHRPRLESRAYALDLPTVAAGFILRSIARGLKAAPTLLTSNRSRRIYPALHRPRLESRAYALDLQP